MSEEIFMQSAFGDCRGVIFVDNLKKVIPPFRVYYDTATHIMKNPPPWLIVGRGQSRSYACAGVLQTCTLPIEGKSVKEDSSDHITIYHFLIDQIL
ncbi:hypothetical protein TNCV_4126201 [Trichonephila clavipes]|nr:hypothetical protein TNCV_4126201 [Trichonephila clavipes]